MLLIHLWHVILFVTPSVKALFLFEKIFPVKVQCAINELNDDFALGPDGIEIKFTKWAAYIVTYPLCDLFNLSLSTCALASAWKCAMVTPLHKGGDHHDMNNCCPISIINSVAKIFEN